jgi:hypothetical protein
MWLLSEAKKRFKKQIAEDGMHCPCCGRWGKVYKYKLNSTIARGLIWMYSVSPSGDWVNIQERGPKWLLRTKSLSTAKHWGLIERLPNDSDEDVRHSGVWRLTARGIQFVKNRTLIEEHVFIFDDTIVKKSKDMASIIDCLGKKFSYQELMNSRMSDDV